MKKGCKGIQKYILYINKWGTWTVAEKASI